MKTSRSIFVVWLAVVVAVAGMALSPISAHADCLGNPNYCTAYTCSGNLYCVGNGGSYNPCTCYGGQSCWVICLNGQWK